MATCSPTFLLNTEEAPPQHGGGSSSSAFSGVITSYYFEIHIILFLKFGPWIGKARYGLPPRI
jgi:hypothetical protein